MIVKFKRVWINADDDSFYAWKIEEKIPQKIFNECKKEGAVWFVDMTEYWGKGGFWSWNVEKAEKVLKRFGYKVDEKSLRKWNEELEIKRKIKEMEEFARNFENQLKCPVCGASLKLGSWTAETAVLHCYEHDYAVVIHKDGRKIEGFEALNRVLDVWFWDRLVEEKMIEDKNFTQEKFYDLIIEKLTEKDGWRYDKKLGLVYEGTKAIVKDDKIICPQCKKSSCYTMKFLDWTLAVCENILGCGWVGIV